MTQREPEFGAELDAAEVAPLLGLALDDLDPALPPQVVSTGAPFAIVVLRTAEALARLKVNQDAATAWLRERGAQVVLRLGPCTRPRPERCEVQGEDAVLWRRRSGHGFGGGLRHQLPGGSRRRAFGHARARSPGRGDRSPQRSFLSAKKDFARVTDVRVAGSTVLVAKGQLFLP